MQTTCDVILADVNHYRVNEFQAADRTLEQIVRFYLEKAKKRRKFFNSKNRKTFGKYYWNVYFRFS